MTPARLNLAAVPLALAGAFEERPEEAIAGSEPVPDHEPGQSPPAINDPTSEGPPLINRSGPDTEAEIDIGAD